MGDKSYARFLTRPIANEGVKVYLYDPYGSKTEHWLRILGEDSDVYRRGQSELYRQAVKTAQNNEEDVNAQFEAKSIEVLASCIVDWSFPEEATMQEKIAFLSDAPRVRDTIEQTIRNTGLFFKKKPKSSSSTAKSGSSSTKLSRATAKA